MPAVYRHVSGASSAFPWTAFLRASSLHIGAAAAAASLRRDVVDQGRTPPELFDQAFAVSRLTPGTNLLALYVLLGRHFAGWRGALQALAIGSLVPSLLACAVAAAYAQYAASPLAGAAMKGARAGALAVLLWAAVRLIRPQLEAQGTRGILVALAAGVATVGTPVPPIIALLVGGVLGATVMKADR